MSNPRQTGPTKAGTNPARGGLLARGYLPQRGHLRLADSDHRAGDVLSDPSGLVQRRRRSDSRTHSAPRRRASPLRVTNQARFVNLDGKVEVKKVNSVNWESADYHTTLDKGDLIRTGGGRRRAHHLRGRHHVYGQERLVRHRRGKRHRSTTAPPASPCTSVPARSIWPPARGSRRVRRPRFPSPTPAHRCRKIAARPCKAIRPATKIRSPSRPAPRNMQVGDQQVEIGKWERVTFANNGPVTKTTVLAPPDLAEPREPRSR